MPTPSFRKPWEAANWAVTFAPNETLTVGISSRDGAVDRYTGDKMDRIRLKQIYDGLVAARNKNYQDDIERDMLMAEEVEEALMMLLEELLDDTELLVT